MCAMQCTLSSVTEAWWDKQLKSSLLLQMLLVYIFSYINITFICFAILLNMHVSFCFRKKKSIPPYPSVHNLLFLNTYHHYYYYYYQVGISVYLYIYILFYCKLYIFLVIRELSLAFLRLLLHNRKDTLILTPTNKKLNTDDIIMKMKLFFVWSW